ncbi:MAG: RNA-binding protein [Gammaproteobacteria bacterium]|nr:RNA-binding protein [Gammaproteobacteria bacterium]
MNLYIGNLARTVTEADLEVIFEGLGHIVFIRLTEDDNSPDARGYAFISVVDERQAHLAVAAMNGKYLKGLRLIVRPVVDRERQARALRAHNLRTLLHERPALHLLKSRQAD